MMFIGTCLVAFSLAIIFSAVVNKFANKMIDKNYPPKAFLVLGVVTSQVLMVTTLLVVLLVI